MIKFLKLNAPSCLVCRSSKALSCLRGHSRFFSDTAHTDLTSKQVVVYGAENENRVRVRRARSSDVPRILRFVREHSRTSWPSLVSTPGALTAVSQLVLADYVARALSQGHSMLAEQISSRRGWLSVRGLALATAVCPWDAKMLERWASCMQDTRSRHLVSFTAHCLRAPGLHDKYGVHKILQVVLILSPEAQNNAEIVQMLVKSVIQRARDVGIPMLRFDVTHDAIVKVLDGLQLKKEWQLNYDVLPSEMAPQENILADLKWQKDSETGSGSFGVTPKRSEDKECFVAVYSALTTPKQEITATSTAPTSASPAATGPAATGPTATAPPPAPADETPKPAPVPS